jgi:hypothetical protein
METIKTQALIGSDRRLSLQLPQELAVGNYEILIVLAPKTPDQPETSTTQPPSSKTYPLRGLPITLSEDFDEPMPDLWDALVQ